MTMLQPRGSGEAASRSARKGRQNSEPAGATLTAGPRSLQRMLGLFDVIARSPDGLSLAELSSRLKSPKSSLLTLLRPMVAGNYLSHSNGRYSLGNESFVLATNILSARKFGPVVRGLMTELQQQCPETIILAVIDRAAQSVMYSDVLESPQLVRYSVPSGTARPLYTSAAGQLLLAYQDEKWREQYLKRVRLKPLTARTVTNIEQLRKKLNSIKRTGLSVSVSEAVEGATGVAAPIFGPDGAILATLLVAGPTDRYSREGQSWGDFARDFASRASRAVGFSGAARQDD
ncbi:MAG: IclR family transcriptional regulator [Hyphomicrobiaceae bacterium]